MSKDSLFSSLKTTSSKLVLFVCILTSSLGFFAASSISIALPVIQLELGATIGQVQWILNSYTLMLGIFVLLAGSLSDRISRKKTLKIGLLIFMLSSLSLALARDINLFILLRFIQGLGAALFIPQGLAIINTNFEGKIRGYVIGLWGGFSGMITIFSPVIGGLLIDVFGWPAIFYFNIPFALVSAFLVEKIVRDIHHPKVAHKFDISGAILLIMFLGFLSYGLILGSETNFNQLSLILLSLSIINLIALIYVELHVKEPIFVIKILKLPHIIGASIFTVIFYGVMGGLFVFVYMLLQQVMGFSATKSSLLLTPPSILVTILGFFTGRLADKYGNRWPTVIGGGLVVIGIFLLRVFDGISYEYNLILGLIFLGVGFGIFVPSLTKAALDVSEQYSGFASGFNNAIARFTPLISTAIFSFIILSSFQTNLINNTKVDNLADTDRLLAMDIPKDVNHEDFKTIMNQGFIDGYNKMIIYALSAGLIGTTAAYLLIKK